MSNQDLHASIKLPELMIAVITHAANLVFALRKISAHGASILTLRHHATRIRTVAHTAV